MSNKDIIKKRVGNADHSTSLVLQNGDTFWNLAEQKYDGKHPIAAIFAANKLKPSYENRDGKPTLIDPVYYAGMEYVLPSAAQIPELETEFWKKFDPRTVQERVGKPDEQALVCIRWDENFSQLSSVKYSGRDASKAIFFANNMIPKVTHQGGSEVIVEPLCQAGCSYIFPAVHEIEELENQYEKQIRDISAHARASSDN